MNTQIRTASRFAALVAALSCTLPAMAEVVATGGWTRATPPGAKTAVGYLVLTNHGTEERKLLKITTPVCDRLSLQQTSVDSEGKVRMWPMGFLKLQPGESLVFEPNGRHLMFDDLDVPLVAGKSVPVTIQFEDEQAFTVMLEVRPLTVAASGQAADHAHRH